jgi:hypothetical protein
MAALLARGLLQRLLGTCCHPISRISCLNPVCQPDYRAHWHGLGLQPENVRCHRTSSAKRSFLAIDAWTEYCTVAMQSYVSAKTGMRLFMALHKHCLDRPLLQLAQI